MADAKRIDSPEPRTRDAMRDAAPEIHETPAAGGRYQRQPDGRLVPMPTDPPPAED